MINNVINLIEYRNLKRISDDGMWTQERLINKIRVIVHRVNTTSDTDDSIVDFIIKSFCINGIIDTYNQLGYAGWYNMILQMAEHEIWERNNV